MNFPWIYVTTRGIEGDWNGGWTHELELASGLPATGSLLDALDAYPSDGNKLGLLLEDAALYPLRIDLEQKASPRELDQFLLWKLKRFLPFPIEDTEMRHLPLSEPNTYLTFSLPKHWIHKVFEGCSERGKQLGYIGGMFTALLENQGCFRGRRSIALFDEFFAAAALDNKGHFRDYRTRRLPLLSDGSGETIDLDTLIHTDWKPLMDEETEPVFLLDFRGGDTPTHLIWDALGNEGLAVTGARPEGPVLARFQAWMKDGVS